MGILLVTLRNCTKYYFIFFLKIKFKLLKFLFDIFSFPRWCSVYLFSTIVIYFLSFYLMKSGYTVCINSVFSNYS